MADDEQPKIIVDEDWKARIEREREEARKAEEEKAAKGPAAKGPEAGTEAPPAEAPSFEGLVSGFAMQAMMALGVLAPRDAKEVMVDLDSAKYVIDSLMVLRDKTKGNLTPAEEGLLAQTLADLQQAYVVRSQQLHEAALRGTGIHPAEKK